jgi:hypothetical protein
MIGIVAASAVRIENLKLQNAPLEVVISRLKRLSMAVMHSSNAT